MKKYLTIFCFSFMLSCNSKKEDICKNCYYECKVIDIVDISTIEVIRTSKHLKITPISNTKIHKKFNYKFLIIPTNEVFYIQDSTLNKYELFKTYNFSNTEYIESIIE